MALPNIRINYRTPFPALVQGVGGVALTKANGVWSVSLDFASLVDTFPVVADWPFCSVSYFNEHTSQIAKLTLSELGIIATTAANTIRIITAGATVNAAATDAILVLNKAAAGATTINLPDINDRQPAGLPLEIYDFAGNAGDMSIVPFGTQLIMGDNSPLTLSSGGAVRTGGATKLIPSIALNGWTAK